MGLGLGLPCKVNGSSRCEGGRTEHRPAFCIVAASLLLSMHHSSLLLSSHVDETRKLSPAHSL